MNPLCPNCQQPVSSDAVLCAFCGSSLQKMPASRRAPVPPFHHRVAAFLIDFAILFIPSMIFASLMVAPYMDQMQDLSARARSSSQLSQAELERSWMYMSTYLGGLLMGWWFLGFFYFPFFENSQWRGTPGKRALRLVVIENSSVEDRKVSLGRLFLRHALRFVAAAFCALPYWLALLNPDRLAVHDRLTRTRVAAALNHQ